MGWRERLRAAVDASGRRQTAIAASAGLNQETVSRVLSGIHIHPAFDTVVRIAHAIGENVGTLIEEPAFVLTGEERAEVSRVIGYLQRAVKPITITLPVQNATEQRTAELPRQYYRRGARMVFQASGDSMIAAGIFDGDLLFVSPVRAVRDAVRRIIVCRVTGKTMVKQLHIRAGRIHLSSRNPRYGPINVDEDDFQLVGIVIGRMGNITS
jgi:SOS-response transcriptional repressor LexA